MNSSREARLDPPNTKSVPSEAVGLGIALDQMKMVAMKIEPLRKINRIYKGCLKVFNVTPGSIKSRIRTQYP